MKKIRIIGCFPCILLLPLLVLTVTQSNAQWYELPGYTNPYLSDSSNYVMGGRGSYPISPLVAGNKVIVYAGNAQPNVGMWTELTIEESANDIKNCSSVYSNASIFPFPEGLVSKSESTYCFMNASFNGVELFYTNNNFSTVSDVSSLNIPTYPITIPTCFSNNFIYFVWDYYYKDTLLIYRNNPSLSITKEYYSGTYKNPVQLFFISDTTGYMICNYAKDSANSVLAKTVDSGATWSDSFLDSVNVITACCFPSASIGYLTENNGNIYKTTNGGASWVKLNSPASIALHCISFSNNLRGLAGGNKGSIYATITGGATWSKQTNWDTFSIQSLYTFDTVAYFIDSRQNIFKNENYTGVENIESVASAVKVFPNPDNGRFTVEFSNAEPVSVSPETSSGQAQIEIYNVLGARIFIEKLKPVRTVYPGGQILHNEQINISSQPNGVYSYRVISESGELIGEGKLIIEK